jgi:hypothetical protein
VPLARLHVNGNITEGVDFMVEGEFDTASENFGLKNAYVGVSPFDHGRLQMGQFRLPFLLEQNIHEDMQMAAQTSAFSNIFGQGYSQGLMFACGNNTLRFRTSLSDGFDTANTNVDDSGESDFAATARIDYAISGKLNNFEQFTTADANENGFMVGAAAHYQDSNDLADSLFTYTADATWKQSNWSLYAAGVGRSVDEAADSFNDFGGIGQVAYRMNNIEPFARFECILPDTDRSMSNDSYNFVSAGVNYYMYGQAAKFTVDAVYAFEATADLASMGAFSDNSLVNSTEDGETSLVAQFQVLF